MTAKSDKDAIRMMNEALFGVNLEVEQKTKEVIVKRYMMEVTTYPNGDEFTRSWLVHKGAKQPTKKKKARKETQQAEVDEAEVY